MAAAAAVLSLSLVLARCSVYSDATEPIATDAGAGAGDAADDASPDVVGDAGDGGALDAARYCVGGAGAAHYLCADFDEDGMLRGFVDGGLESIWALADSDAGSLTYVGNALSPPHAILAVGGDAGATAATGPVLDYAGYASKGVHVELDLHVEATTSAPPPLFGEVLKVAYGSPTGSSVSFALVADDSAEIRVVSGSTTFGPALATPFLGNWTHVTFAVSGGKVSASAGASAPTTLPLPSSFPVGATSFHLFVGLADYLDGPYAFRIDNVTIDDAAN